MSEISIEEMLSVRFTPSAKTDRCTEELMEGLGLSTKASVARLALGRSLSLGEFSNEEIDSRGRAIDARTLLTQDYIAIWVGLIVTHARTYGDENLSTLEKFRVTLRKHWHRGVSLLYEDWKNCDEDFDGFIDTLIKRSAELPETGSAYTKHPTSPDEDHRKPVDPADQSAALVKVLASLGVVVEIKDSDHGPRVTRYRIFLPDVNQLDKLNKGLEQLALSLGLEDSLPVIRRSNEEKTILLDIPRPESSWHRTLYKDLCGWLDSDNTQPDELVIYPGVDVMGHPFKFDLAKAPHLLVAGSTGQGKSVCLHALILSLMARHEPTSLQLALIDPKKVEFSVYEGCKFLWGDGVALSVVEAQERISSLTVEMDARYEQFKCADVTNILEAREKGLNLPYIVVFIEELADLVLQNKELENEIVRLAQLARAAGIHLILATQRPDSKTLSGLIRGNVNARIALKVQKSTESKIILDETGAENLLGAGDMLVKASSKLERVHGVLVSRDDVKAFLSSV